MSKPNFIVRCHASCKSCGRIEAIGDNADFLTSFFLPAMCAGCGKWPDWIVTTRKLRRVPAIRSFWNPLTWCRRDKWIEVERSDRRAR